MIKLWQSIARWLSAAPEDQTFTTLVQIATEDAAVRGQLLAVLELPENDRRIRLQLWLDGMQAEGAPPEFTAAITRLTNPAIANRLRTLLEELESGKGET